MSFPLVITGMHRSGTSLISAFVHKSGVSMGDGLIGPGVGNVRGHFEECEIVEFHTALLAKRSCLGEDAEQFARDYIARRATRPAWGWKDPRTCEFLDFWSRHLPEATFLFMIRHPFDVVNSLRRRDGGEWHWKADTVGLQRWEDYTARCLAFARRHSSQCIVAVLDHVLAAPERFTTTLSERLGYSFSPAALNGEFEPSLLVVDPSPFQVITLPTVYLSSLSLYRRACRLSQRWSHVHSPTLALKGAMKDLRTQFRRVMARVKREWAGPSWVPFS